MRFEGPYDPKDLRSHYAGVHLAWCIDLYEAGANSDWLLPNRLYESVHFGSVPIARLNCETGRFLDDHDIGIALDDLSPEALSQRLGSLGTVEYRALLTRQHRLPRSMWMANKDDCIALAKTLVTAPRQLANRHIAT